MASFTLGPDPRFPAGTVLTVYEDGTLDRPPAKNPVMTGTVGAAGTVTFDGLSANTRYVTGVLAGGVWRATAFTTDPDLFSPDSSVVKALTSEFRLVNPAITPALSGSFVADREAVLVDVDVTALLSDPGGFHAGVHFYWADLAQVPAAQLTPAHQADALAAGVSHLRVGSTGGGNFHGTVHGSLTLTGLTPGRTYRWEVSLAVVGYAAPLAVPGGANPFKLAVSKQASKYPEASFFLACRDNGNPAKLHVWRLDHISAKYADYYLGSVALPAAATLGTVAVTPDGSRVVVTNQQAGSVTTITTGAATVVGAKPADAIAKQGDYALPGTAPAPSPVAVSADGLTAYVGVIGGGAAGNQGKLVPVTLASGAMGTPIDLGQGATATPNFIVPDTAGTYLYVGVGTVNKVLKVRLSDGAVVATRNITSPTAAALSPDGLTLWTVARDGGNGHLFKLATADLTDQAAAVVPVEGAPTGVAAFSDGRGLLVVADTTTQQQVMHILTSDMSMYTPWKNNLTQAAGINFPAFDVAITPNGAIYTTGYNDKTVNAWFGGVIDIKPGSDFDVSELRVRVAGAH